MHASCLPFVYLSPSLWREGAESHSDNQHKVDVPYQILVGQKSGTRVQEMLCCHLLFPVIGGAKVQVISLH